MPNRLIHEKSPYLLQHAENPVDWYPWGEEAFARAKAEDKPVFLSVGYASCHWCHVMAHESFEDAEVAAFLNEHFVSMKLDREERPDVDGIYMTVCQAFTGGAGWPLSVFMTPEGKPFFAGTYFPKRTRSGMPGFLDLARQIAAMWGSHREKILRSGDEVARALKAEAEVDAGAEIPDAKVMGQAYAGLSAAFDAKNGGFGTAPKFPSPHQLLFLLRWFLRSGERRALEMTQATLEAMRRGGIFDQIGLGFHRYSVDAEWRVPHFEKMLYDQAMLMLAYTEGCQATGSTDCGRVVREIAEYVLRDLAAPDGGFACAEDADSEGGEGAYYVWTPAQVRDVLGPEDAELACRFFGIAEAGNFEGGASVPYMPVNPGVFAAHEGLSPQELFEVVGGLRRRLFEARQRRPRPLRDDKVLTSWNGLMIAALARAARVMNEPAWAGAAGTAARFLLGVMKAPKGRLHRRYREGEARYPGLLDDYAFLVWGLIELHQATFETEFLEEAVRLARRMIDDFWDTRRAAFFYTPEGVEDLIVRSRQDADGALPSGTSVAVDSLLKLGRLTGETAFEDVASAELRALSKEAGATPVAFFHLLSAADYAMGPTREISIAGDRGAPEVAAFVRVLRERFLPRSVFHLVSPGEDRARLVAVAPDLQGIHPVDGRPAAYLCENFRCGAPVVSPQDLARALDMA